MVGVGSVGSEILKVLLKSNPDQLSVVDFDRVDQSNTIRQSLYSLEDVGAYKVEAIIRKFPQVMGYAC